MINRRVLCSLIPFIFVVACDSETDKDGAMPTRPVTVMELTESDYPRERALTGVVGLYREEQIGFEIGGRVGMVLDVGIEVRGPAFDENGKLVRQGDAIASILDSHVIS